MSTTLDLKLVVNYTLTDKKRRRRRHGRRRRRRRRHSLIVRQDTARSDRPGSRGAVPIPKLLGYSNSRFRAIHARAHSSPAGKRYNTTKTQYKIAECSASSCTTHGFRKWRINETQKCTCTSADTDHTQTRGWVSAHRHTVSLYKVLRRIMY